MIKYLLRWLSALLILFTITTNLAGAAGVYTFVSPNQAQGILYPVPMSHTAVVLRVDTGHLNIFESGPLAGIAHYIEHTRFLGTPKDPTQAALKSRFDQIGAQWNAMTTAEGTTYFLVVPSENTHDAIRLMVDMMEYFATSHAEVKNEGRPVQQEILRDRFNNPYFALHLDAQVLHGVDPRFKHLATGSDDQIASQNPEDLRKFFDTYYVANNMMLSVVGGIENPAATQDFAIKELMRLKMRPLPLKYELRGDAEPKPRGVLTLYKRKAPVGSPRLLQIGWPTKNLGKNEHVQLILRKYFGREGVGSVLNPLVESGYVLDSGVMIEQLNNDVDFRMTFQLTEAGEANVKKVVDYFSSVMGSLAKNSLPNEVVEDLKLSYQLLELGGVSILDVAQNLAEAGQKYGLNNIGQHTQTVLSVTPEDVQAVASKFDPNDLQLTMYTQNVQGKMHPYLQVPVETVDLSSELAALKASFDAGQAQLDVSANPFLHHEKPRVLHDRGMEIFVFPDISADSSSARLEIELTDAKMGPLDRTAGELGVEAIKKDPANARFFSQLREAGFDVQFAHEPKTNVLTISVAGNSRFAPTVLEAVVHLLKSVPVSPAGFEIAKRERLEALRTSITQEVSLQARMMAFARLFSRPARSIEDRMERIQSITVEHVSRVMAVGRKRWAVKGLLTGNWSEMAMLRVQALLKPPLAKAIKFSKNKAQLPKTAYAAEPSIVQFVTVEHQGVARVHAVNVGRYSQEWVDFKIFAQLFGKRTMDVVRTKDGLTYTGSAQFTSLTKGGSALYIYADSSHSSRQLLDAIAETYETLMAPGGITEEEFQVALNEVAGELGGLVSGPMGIYNQRFNGVDPEVLQTAVQTASLNRMLETVKAHIAAGRTIDSVASGPFDDCDDALGGRKAPISGRIPPAK